MYVLEDFLTEKEKTCIISNSFVFIFSKKRLQNDKNMTKNSSKKGTKVAVDNLKQLGGPNFTYAEGLVKFGLHLAAL